MNFSNRQLERDVQNIYMRNQQRAAIDFTRYMYAYGLYAQNLKLQASKTEEITLEGEKLTESRTPQYNPFNIYMPYYSLIQRSTNKITVDFDNVDIQLKPANLNKVVIMVGNNKNGYLMVRDTTTNKWMVPGGDLDSKYNAFAGAIKIFKSDTNFDLNTREITGIKYVDILHSNRKKTRFFKVETPQNFTITDLEKTNVEKKTIKDIQGHLPNSTHFNTRTLQTFTHLFHIKFFEE